MARIMEKRRMAWHAAGLAMFAAWGVAAAQTAPPQIVAQIDQRQGPTHDYLYLTEPLPTSEYWIGIALGGSIPEVLKAQLGLEHGQVVSDVMDDSPAAKAGFRENDVLIRAGDTPLKDPADVIKAVDAAKENELTITLVREGEERTLKVTPIKRPRSTDAGSPLGIDLRTPEVREEIGQLEEALTRLKAKVGEEAISIFLARPPVVAHREVLDPVELPKNVKIRVTKEGDKPAQIHVQRDDEEWDVTEETLDKLPEDLREHVQPFLSRPRALRLKATAVPPPAGGQSARATVRVEPAGKVQRQVEVRSAYPQAGAIRTPDGGSVRLSRPLPVLDRPQATDAKLDAILKKLDQIEGRSLEKLESEVNRLREELDELRGGKSTKEADKP